MSDYSVDSMAERVFASSDVSDRVGFIEWLPLIAEVLPLLFDLPCFAKKTAEQRRKFVERNPNWSKLMAARKLRDKNRHVTRAEAYEVGTQMVEIISSATDTEIRSFGQACGISC